MSSPYPLASREQNPEDAVVQVADLSLGASPFVVIAGPCSVEDEASFLRVAAAVRTAGAHMLRGGAFKPRTSPYSFQGLGKEGLRILALAKRQTGLPVVTEILDPRDVEEVAAVADVLQVGARNMQNFPLLKELGRARRPVLLKRGLAATLEEWLLAAEYILSSGNEAVILCERGQRLLGETGRCGFDVGAIPTVRELSRLPVFVDPSHAAGARRRVGALARAAAAAGAHGLLIEVHEQPEKALSDADQSLSIEDFQSLMTELSALTRALGRRLAGCQAFTDFP
ncbi:MAG TPA: 3-deoxy-7-phosphoheptulonate synthase [Elusimicrobia bacterium]|nr:3-deoxy-7-phosphoheptulonate synthase [Elusimicrobiota bacterium]HBT61384.1 3-deoxy-7-phosphoheptulonate synthase [Elusimicrobiota bacterium]